MCRVRCRVSFQLILAFTLVLKNWLWCYYVQISQDGNPIEALTIEGSEHGIQNAQVVNSRWICNWWCLYRGCSRNPLHAITEYTILLRIMVWLVLKRIIIRFVVDGTVIYRNWYKRESNWIRRENFRTLVVKIVDWMLDEKGCGILDDWLEVATIIHYNLFYFKTLYGGRPIS